MADACVRLLGLSREEWDEKIGLPFANVGCGIDQTIAELARLIAETVGFKGALEFVTAKPDGTPQKLLDVS